MNNIYLYCAYADDTTLFVNSEEFVIEVVNAFDNFSLLSGLKLIKPKCEIADIGALKTASLSHCGINSTKTIIKTLGILSSYYKKPENEGHLIKHMEHVRNGVLSFRILFKRCNREGER